MLSPAELNVSTSLAVMMPIVMCSFLVRYVSFLGHVAYLQFSPTKVCYNWSTDEVRGLNLESNGRVLLNDANEIRSRI